MHQTTITVQYVNQPDKYPDWGSVKTSDGTRYSVPKNMIQIFGEKKTYKIGYTTNEKGYHTIKEAHEDSPASGHNGSPKANGSDPRQIFVCAIVKEWVPRIPVGETTTLISAIQSAMDAYDQTFGQ